MEPKKENKKNDKVEEPRVEYELQKPKIKGIDRETFDFDAEFAKGFTLEQAKAESIRGIREWWGENNCENKKQRSTSETFDFDTAFDKGLTPEEFKNEMSKRIKAYPWKKITNVDQK